MNRSTRGLLHQRTKPIQGYQHQRWELQRRFLRFLIRSIGMTLLARVDQVDGLEFLPKQGPAILMINHIAFVDPIIVLHLVPRNIVPLAKIEVYNYPIVGIFPRLWGVIPVHREESDRRAVQRALEVLRSGEMILVAPEATRSPQLQEGKVGVAYLASRTGAPIIPVAIDGTVGFPALRFTARWRQPGAMIRFGRPFRYRLDLRHPGKEQLRLMTDEAMYILARMLPEKRRGVYANLEMASETTIEWL